MGRKSNTKKVLRKKLKEEEASAKKPLKRSTKKKIRKQVKKQLDKSSKPKLTKKQEQKKQEKQQKFIGGITVAVAFLVLIFFGYLIFQKAFRAMPIAKILPADDTVAFVEINTDLEHNQYLKAMDLIADHMDFLDEKYVQRLELLWGINFETTIRPWLGRQMGMALINSSQNSSVAHLLYFAEIGNQELLQEKLDDNAEVRDYKGFDVYVTEPSAYMTVLKGHLVVSVEEVGLHTLIDGYLGESQKLYYTSKYRRIDDNAPLNAVSDVYIDFDLVDEGSLSYFPFLTENGINMEIMNSVKALFDAQGMSLVALDEQFALQGFVSLDRGNFSGSRYIDSKIKYDAKLANYVQQDALAFWGGEDFGSQITRLISVLSAGNKTKQSLLGSLLDNYSQRYFGAEISLEEDITPLLAMEFAVALEPGKNGTANYKLLLEMEDPETDSKRLANVVNQFAQVSAIFEPTVVDYILPDGTFSREVVASPQSINTANSKYRDVTVHSLETAQNNWGIYYATIDNIAVVTDNFDALKQTIDLVKDSSPSLGDSQVFATELKSILRTSDEISYFNIEKLMPILFGENIPETLVPVASYSSGRNYFQDGITGVSYLQLK